MDELKPCPFCGGKVVVSKIYSVNEYQIICIECGVTVHPFCATNEKIASEAWNRREE